MTSSGGEKTYEIRRDVVERIHKEASAVLLAQLEAVKHLQRIREFGGSGETMPLTEVGENYDGSKKGWSRLKNNSDAINEMAGDRRREEAALTKAKERSERRWNLAKAMSLVFGGGIVVCIFSDPMVGAISAFATASGIPAFFVSFIITPIASNSSEVYSSLFMAMKKDTESLTVTFTQLYGAATMNNTVCLSVFLALVYFRSLRWNFSAEVITILMCNVVAGVFGLSKSLRTWYAIIMLAMFPICIALISALKYGAHWE